MMSERFITLLSKKLRQLDYDERKKVLSDYEEVLQEKNEYDNFPNSSPLFPDVDLISADLINSYKEIDREQPQHLLSNLRFFKIDIILYLFSSIVCYIFYRTGTRAAIPGLYILNISKYLYTSLSLGILLFVISIVCRLYEKKMLQPIASSIGKILSSGILCIFISFVILSVIGHTMIMYPRYLIIYTIFTMILLQILSRLSFYYKQ